MSEGCSGEKGEKLDLMGKNQKYFFSHGNRVFLIRNHVRNPEKIVSMLYDNDFWCKLTFFEDLGKQFFLPKSAKSKNSKKCIYLGNTYTKIDKLCEVHDQQ